MMFRKSYAASTLTRLIGPSATTRSRAGPKTRVAAIAPNKIHATNTRMMVMPPLFI